MAQTKTKRNGKDAPHCETCEMNGGKAYPHKETEKCNSYCSHCGRGGHHMSLCYDLKFCNLCGKAGHNPYRCWTYSTIRKWVSRARQLDICTDCLRPWKPSIRTETSDLIAFCSHWNNHRYRRWPQCNEKPCCDNFHPPRPKQSTESQTEAKATKDQESQMELQQMETKLQTEEIKKQIADLEGKLKNSLSTINNLSWQLQATIQERENALHRAKKLHSVCQARDLELIDAKSIMEELQAEISQKDLELKQHREILNTQPSSSTLAASSSEHTGELKQMKASLEDLQVQQQKISLIISHLYYGNRIKTSDTTGYHNSYPSFSFNPYMGLWDTGQNCNKLQ